MEQNNPSFLGSDCRTQSIAEYKVAQTILKHKTISSCLSFKSARIAGLSDTSDFTCFLLSPAPPAFPVTAFSTAYTQV